MSSVMQRDKGLVVFLVDEECGGGTGDRTALSAKVRPKTEQRSAVLKDSPSCALHLSMRILCRSEACSAREGRSMIMLKKIQGEVVVVVGGGGR